MKYTYSQFKELLPELNWTATELAEKLSLAGHEAELVGKDQLDVTLTANRKDCQDLKHLVFDLAGIYGLKTEPDIISYKPGKPIAVTAAQINHLLGSKIEFTELKDLERLGFEATATLVTPPDFRDVETIADVAEEVVRQIGYAKLAVEPLQKQDALMSESYDQLLSLKCALIRIGLTETATNSFTSSGVVEVKDPFSREEPYLRPNLLAGLLKTLARNPYLKRSAFFEVGNVFTPSEVTKLGVVIAGYKDVEMWSERVNRAIGTKVTLKPVDTKIAEENETKQPRLHWFEIPIAELKPVTASKPKSIELPLPKFKPISKYPPLVRDITYDETNEHSKSTFDGLCEANNILLTELIDRYENRVTYRLIWQNMAGSYTETEIQAIDKQLDAFSAA